MAAFQVIMNGRFWVITEESAAMFSFFNSQGAVLKRL